DDVVGLDVLVQHVPAVEGAKAGDGLDDDVLRVHHRQAGALPQQFAEGGAGHVFRQVVEECLGAGRLDHLHHIGAADATAHPLLEDKTLDIGRVVGEIGGGGFHHRAAAV